MRLERVSNLGVGEEPLTGKGSTVLGEECD